MVPARMTGGETPLLDDEAWDAPARLSVAEWLDAAGGDDRRRAAREWEETDEG